MSESVFEFGTYNVFEVGKMIKSSKKKHVWKLKIDGKVLEIRVLESIMSNKFRVMVQDRIIYDHRSTEEAKRFGLDLIYQGNALFIKKFSDNRYELQINGQKFLPRCTRRLVKYASKEKVSPKAFTRPKSGDLRSLTPEADEVMSKEWQDKHEDFLEYTHKDQMSDDELFGRDDEVTLNRVEPSQFDFGESSQIEISDRFLTESLCLAVPQQQPRNSFPQTLEIKMKKKQQPTVEGGNLGNFLDFEFGAEKEEQIPESSQRSPPTHQIKSKGVMSLFGDDEVFKSPRQEFGDLNQISNIQNAGFGGSPPRDCPPVTDSNLFDAFDLALSSPPSEVRKSPPPKDTFGIPHPAPTKKGPTIDNDPFSDFSSEFEVQPAVKSNKKVNETKGLFSFDEVKAKSNNRLDELDIPNVDFNELVLGDDVPGKQFDPFSLAASEKHQNFHNEFKKGLVVGEQKRPEEDFFF